MLIFSFLLICLLIQTYQLEYFEVEVVRYSEMGVYSDAWARILLGFPYPHRSRSADGPQGQTLLSSWEEQIYD